MGSWIKTFKIVLWQYHSRAAFSEAYIYRQGHHPPSFLLQGNPFNQISSDERREEDQLDPENHHNVLGRKRNYFYTHTHTHTWHIQCLNVNFSIIKCNVPVRKFLFWATSKYSVKRLFLLLKGKYQKSTSLGGPQQPCISLAMLPKRLSLGKDPMEQSQRNASLRGKKHGLRMLKPNNMDWLQLITPIYYENIQEQQLNVHTMCKKSGSVSWIGLSHTGQATPGIPAQNLDFRHSETSSMSDHEP